MTIAGGPRFKAAEVLITRFAAAARPKPGKTKAETAKRAAALQRSPAGWPVRRIYLRTS